MNHNKHTLTEKAFIRAERALGDIWEKQRKQPWRKLDKPFQHGWWLSIALREEYKDLTAAPVFLGLLKAFGVTTVCTNQKIITKIRQKPDLGFVRALMTDKRWKHYWGPYIKSLNQRAYDRLPERQQKYFVEDRFYGAVKSDYPYRVNIPEHYLIVKTQKRMVTHVRDIDPALAREEARLKKILAPYWRTFSNGEGGIYHWFANKKERRSNSVKMHQLAIDYDD